MLSIWRQPEYNLLIWCLCMILWNELYFAFCVYTYVYVCIYGSGYTVWINKIDAMGFNQRSKWARNSNHCHVMERKWCAIEFYAYMYSSLPMYLIVLHKGPLRTCDSCHTWGCRDSSPTLPPHPIPYSVSLNCSQLMPFALKYYTIQHIMRYVLSLSYLLIWIKLSISLYSC